MGKAKKRVSPQVVNNVNRNLDNLMIRSIIRAVKKIDAPWEENITGRPCRDPRIVAICCFLKIYFNRTYDGIEAYLKANTLVCELLHVDTLPGHSVIARGMNKLSMRYIRKVSRHITFQMRRRGMDVVVDSTGFSLKTSSKWFDIRVQRVSKRKDHIKLHIVIDADTLVILHFTITGWKGSDSKEFKRLIRDLPRLGKVAGDKIYSSRKNCQMVADKNGTPYFAFKTNVTGKSKGYPAWRISFKSFTNNPDEWMNEYHIRSVVEAVFASIKRCWGSDIKSRKGWLKRRELGIKMVAYNTKRTLYIERAEELEISLWVLCK